MHLTGVLHYQHKEYTSAIKLIQSAIRINPTQALYYSNLGNVLKDAGQTDEAAHAYLHALEIDSHLYFAYNNLGLVYKQQKKWLEAKSAFLKALEQNPDYVDSLRNISNLLADMNQADEPCYGSFSCKSCL